MSTSRQEAEHAAATWIAQRDAGPWTNDDAIALEAWLAASASHRAAYYRLNAAWLETGRLKAMGGAGIPLPAPHRTSRARPVWFALAASLLVAVGAGWFAWQSGVFVRSDYSTVVGGLQTVPMPDGSKVTLNTDSKLRVAITESERRMELQQGEAYFEVAKDPVRPFVVHAGNRRIVAVGTAFSVRREGDNVRVTVTEGRVRVEAPGQAPESLSAGATVRTESDALMVQQRPLAELEQDLSWRSGQLIFRDTPLAAAIEEFNRYNTRQIVIADPAIATLQVGGIFRATNLDPFVKLLQDGFPVSARVEGETITLVAK